MRLRPCIQISETHVIPEAADEVEAKRLDSSGNALLREVGVSHDEIADGPQLSAVAGEHPQIPSGKGIGILHPFGALRLAATLLVGECLLGLEKDRVPGVGIHDGDAEYLQPLLHGRCTPRPEPVNAGVFLPDLEM